MKLSDAVKGKWEDIFRALLGWGDEILSSKHHPCPQCGGTDRFRVMDDFNETGGLVCNQCHNGKPLSNGYKSLAWALGVDEKEVARKLREHFGIKMGRPASSDNPKKQQGPASQLRWMDWAPAIVPFFLDRRKGITEDSLIYCGARFATYKDRQTVIALPIFGQDLDLNSPVGYCVMDARGGTISHKNRDGSITQLKIKTTSGSAPGLIGMGAVSKLSVPGLVRRCWKVEGVPDLLALTALIPEERRETEVVVTNGFGAMENPDWMADILAACHEVVIIGDADVTGKNGAIKWAAEIANKGGTPSIATLPYPIEAAHGKDLRDWIVDGATYSDFCVLAERAAKIIKSDEPDPYLNYRTILAAINLEVLYENDRGQIRVFSHNLKKSSWIQDVGKIRYDNLVQVGGLPITQTVARPMTDIAGNQIEFERVREAIAVIASSRRGSHLEVGCGIWPGETKAGTSRTIVMVNNDHISRYNGDRILTRSDSPYCDGVVAELGSRVKNWYDHEEMVALVKEMEDPNNRRELMKKLDEVLSQWRWAMTTDPLLCAGLLAATMIQTLWKWRPHVAVYGESQSGKSFLFDFLGGRPGEPGLFGDLVVMSGSGVTEPGVRQSVGRSAGAVLLDEFEKSPHRDSILNLLRNSSRGSVIRKGTADQSRASEFVLRHIGWIASTETGLRAQPDLNRFICLELLKPARESSPIVLPTPQGAQMMGKRLLAAMIWGASEILELADRLVVECRDLGEFRMIENYAPPAACLAVLMGRQSDAGKLLATLARSHDEEAVEADWERLLTDIAGSEVLRAPGGDIYTVGRILHSDGNISDTSMVKSLEGKGIRTIADGRVFIHPAMVMRHLLKGTEWQGQRISDHIRRIPGAEKICQRINGSPLKGWAIPSIFGSKTAVVEEESSEVDDF
jgi:Zinc-binding domain of primase-helicase/Toprim-like